MTSRTIADFMTRAPHTIGQGQSLETAMRIMRAHSIRHLPVLEGAVLVGLLSERDVQVLESVKGVDFSAVCVGDVMSREAFAVAPSESVARVASTMAKRKYGSVVVVDHDCVVGVFTTVDALAALAASEGETA